MTVRMASRKDEYCGLSTDIKPTPDFPMAEFYETNTGQNWIWDGEEWVEDLKLFRAMTDALAEYM